MGITATGLKNASFRASGVKEDVRNDIEFLPFANNTIDISFPVDAANMIPVSLGSYASIDLNQWPDLRFEITGVPLQYFQQGGDRLVLFPENSPVTYYATLKVFSGIIESPSYNLIVRRV